MDMTALIPYDNSPEEEKDLTIRQERFAQEYVVDGNGTQSAIRAGYSRKTARKIASNLLSQTHVRNRVNELKKALATKHEITLDWIVVELKKMAGFNAGAYIVCNDEGVPRIDISKMTRDDMAAIESFELDYKNQKIKVKTHGKKEALRMLKEIAIQQQEAGDDDSYEIKHVFEFEHNDRDDPV